MSRLSWRARPSCSSACQRQDRRRRKLRERYHHPVECEMRPQRTRTGEGSGNRAVEKGKLTRWRDLYDKHLCRYAALPSPRSARARQRDCRRARAILLPHAGPGQWARSPAPSCRSFQVFRKDVVSGGSRTCAETKDKIAAHFVERTVTAEDPIAAGRIRAPQDGMVMHRACIRSAGGHRAGDAIHVIVPQATTSGRGQGQSPGYRQAAKSDRKTAAAVGVNQRTKPELIAPPVTRSRRTSHRSATGQSITRSAYRCRRMIGRSPWRRSI